MVSVNYECKGNNGVTEVLHSLAQAKAFVENYGGSYKVTYEPIKKTKPKNPAWKNPMSPWYAINHQ